MNAFEVALDGVDGDVQFRGNFLVAVVSPAQQPDIFFAGGEVILHRFQQSCASVLTWSDLPASPKGRLQAWWESSTIEPIAANSQPIRTHQRLGQHQGLLRKESLGFQSSFRREPAGMGEPYPVQLRLR